MPILIWEGLNLLLKFFLLKPGSKGLEKSVSWHFGSPPPSSCDMLWHSPVTFCPLAPPPTCHVLFEWLLICIFLYNLFVTEWSGCKPVTLKIVFFPCLGKKFDLAECTRANLIKWCFVLKTQFFLVPFLYLDYNSSNYFTDRSASHKNHL